MKWFTATNESSLEEDSFFELLAAAVLSAQKNTSLDPHLLYEGSLQHERLRWLKQRGVTVVPHELTFRDEIEEFCRSNGYDQRKIDVRTGAYLRSELPLALMRHCIDDNIVLYTDCDVLFIRDPNLSSVTPKNFAAYGQWEAGYTKYNFGGFKHYNTGVMIMNINSMYKDHNKFVSFVLNNGYNVKRPRPNSKYWQKNLMLSDQVAYNLFYKGNIGDIRRKYNCNPASEERCEAKIIHFNGLKWNQIDELKSGSVEKKRYYKMYKGAGEAYDHYRDLARGLLAETSFWGDTLLEN